MEVNHCVVDGSFDLILSIGQVVPHEVIGMSNYTKNILVGLGGRPMINGTICWALSVIWRQLWEHGHAGAGGV